MQIGDVVFLKSGGPAMVVSNRTTDGIYVDWFAGGTHYYATFPEAALVLGDPTPALDAARQVSTEQEVAKLKPTPVAGPTGVATKP